MHIKSIFNFKLHQIRSKTNAENSAYNKTEDKDPYMTFKMMCITYRKHIVGE